MKINYEAKENPFYFETGFREEKPVLPLMTGFKDAECTELRRIMVNFFPEVERKVFTGTF